MTGAPEGSPKVVLCGFMEKPGIEPGTPGLQKKKTFCGFPWVETSTAGRVYDLCFFFLLYDRSTRRLTESGFMWFYGFMEKPGIEPATPGLQGIALIHYTTGASVYKKKLFVAFPG